MRSIPSILNGLTHVICQTTVTSGQRRRRKTSWNHVRSRRRRSLDTTTTNESKEWTDGVSESVGAFIDHPRGARTLHFARKTEGRGEFSGNNRGVRRGQPRNRGESGENAQVEAHTVADMRAERKHSLAHIRG
jgi:hypothetical protein